MNDSLDWEESATWQLTVEARDGGGRSGTSVVLITVQDENDNAPLFPLSVYSVSVAEGTAPVHLLKLQVEVLFRYYITIKTTLILLVFCL